MNKVKFNFELLIVANKSMAYSTVLGRDFMNICNFKIVRENDCSNDSFANDSPNDSIKVYCGYKETQSDSCKMIESSQDLSVQPSDHFESEIMSIEYPDPAECNLLNISDKCAFTLRKKLIDIFDRFYTKPKRPEIPLVKWETKLNFYTTKPFNYPPRRLSYAEKSQVQNLLYGYIKNGIIRVSESEYASPIVLVKKKSGQLRMCVDYQTLNKIFADLVKEDKVLIYMDDILIATKDSKSHMEILTEVFRRLVDNKLELRLDKCEFLQREIKSLESIFKEYSSK